VEYRLLGRAGLKPSLLTFGTMTFGGEACFSKPGSTDVAGAQRPLDLCLDAGVNVVDTANVYARRRSEEILGAAMEGRCHRIGARTEAPLSANLRAAELKVTTEATVRLDDVSLQPRLYPCRHQANTALSRPGAADLSLMAPHPKTMPGRF
jgi:aryl-alcohol dehydrogenase-like predicted oxidoreductase